MPRASNVNHSAEIAQQRDKFPGSQYGDQRLLRAGVDVEFETAMAGSEEAIQKLLTANPYLLQYVVPNSGHHGTWVFPKKTIRTQKVDGTSGLIPDYLIVTRGSLGYYWHIIELKRATIQFSNLNGKSFSRSGNEGIAQCSTYLSHFSNYIETIRSNIGVAELIAPKNVILLIGDAQTETETQRVRRSEFSELAPRMIVASYDRIRRGLANDLRNQR